MARIQGKSLVGCFAEKEREIENSVGVIDSSISETEKQVSAANLSRDSAITKLAVMFLGHRDEQEGPLTGVTLEIQGIFDRRSTRRAEIDGVLLQARSQRTDARARLAKAREVCDTDAQALDAAVTRVDQQLAWNKDFVVLDAQAMEARRLAANAKNEHEELIAECENKRRVFEGDQVFQQLNRTASAAPRNGLFGRIDRHIRESAGFPENLRRFEILGALPGYSARQVDSLDDAAKCAQARLDTARRAIESGENVPALTAALEQHRAEVIRLETLSVKIDQDIVALETERQLIDQDSDPFLAKAKSRIRECLQGETIEQLRARARATPEKDDDLLVEQLAAAETVVKDARKQIKKLRAERAAFQAQLDQLRTAHREFERRYTGTYDQFQPGLNMDGLLTGFMLGQLSSSSLWSQVNSSYHDATPQYDYTNSSSSSSSSGFGGGDSSSVSSFGGGDSSGSGSSFGGGS